MSSRTSSPRWRLTGGILLSVLWLDAGAAAAEWKESHKLGVAALEAQRWADAERFFRKATAERSQEKVNRLLKTVYLPHYYLGVALAEQGDCRSGLASWATSRKQGAIQKSKPHVDDMERRRLKCQSHLRQVDGARTEVQQLLGSVAEASQSLASISRNPEFAPLWDQGDPSFGSRQEAADQRLQEALRRFEEGSRMTDLEALDDAKTLAREALDRYQDTTRAARERLGRLNAATASALERLEKTEQSAQRVLRSISDLAPYPRHLGAQVSAVEAKLQEVGGVKASAGPKVLGDLADELTASLAALQRAARRPPEILARAAEAYLGGAFEETLELLADERLAGDSRAARHVCLLKAASRHALWVLGGERDDELRGLAARELATCGSENDLLRPGARYFSPRFIEFHRATVESVAEDGGTAAGDETTAGDTR